MRDSGDVLPAREGIVAASFSAVGSGAYLLAQYVPDLPAVFGDCMRG